jgi:outer membrane protein OmpA-like peptidoglycan-associated protein
MNVLKAKLRAGIGVALCVVMLPVHAAEATDERPGQASKQSDIGALSGLAIGALAGGPVGAVVGAAAGAVLGDRYHHQALAKKALVQDLDRSEAERVRLSQNLAQLDTSLAQAQAQGAQLVETLQHTDEVGLDVNFRTNDDAIAVQSMSPLLKLGALLVAMPQASVRVAGYADPRGSDAYNDDLSLRRADSVAAVLVTAGVPRERIVIEAHGKTEAAGAEGDLDAYAFDRRVTVRLELPGASQVARRD